MLPCHAWDLAVVLHLLAQSTPTQAPTEEGGLEGVPASPASVLEGDLKEPVGGQRVVLPSADRFAACSHPLVLVARPPPASCLAPN